MRLFIWGVVWLCVSCCLMLAEERTDCWRRLDDRAFQTPVDTVATDSLPSDRGNRVYPYFYIGLVPGRWKVSGGIGLRYRWLSLDGGGIVPDGLPVIAAGSPSGAATAERFHHRMIGGDISAWYEWNHRLASYLSLGLYWGDYTELGRDEQTGKYHRLMEGTRLVPGVGLGTTYDIPSALIVSGVRFHFTLGLRAHTVTGIAVTYGFGFRD